MEHTVGPLLTDSDFGPKNRATNFKAESNFDCRPALFPRPGFPAGILAVELFGKIVALWRQMDAQAQQVLGPGLASLLSPKECLDKGAP